MSMSLEALVNLLTTNGVTVVVLAWFMFRMEKKVEDLTAAIRELCNQDAQGKTS